MSSKGAGELTTIMMKLRITVFSERNAAFYAKLAKRVPVWSYNSSGVFFAVFGCFD